MMKPTAFALWALALAHLFFRSTTAAAVQTDIAGPAGSAVFGQTVKVLPNGNFVVLDPQYAAPGPIAGAGRVYLYNGKTLALINTMTGAAVNDAVGSGGVTVLANGDYVVATSSWNNGTGAVTRCSATSGCPAAISAANSLVGAAVTPGVGAAVVALPNGNYVVQSWNWNNAIGAVTWCSGTSNCVGAVSTANSLVGSTSGDMVGAYSVIVLANGNYVVQSAAWNNGAATNVGAVTRCSGTAVCTGTVSPANSLVGSTSSDSIGTYIIPLTNGGYVVDSPQWDNGAIVDAGAATFCNSASGCTGTVSATNSLIGSTASDQVGLTTVALNNGNYVVGSLYWDNGANVDAGAVTFGNGTTGRVGTITSANSLVGTTAYEQVGGFGATALTNGNYVVSSPYWDNPVGPINNAGAVTLCSGTSGCTGTVTAANSLTGPSADDSVGAAPTTALANGNYIVGSPYWDNHAPFAPDAGAVTLCNGASGCAGMVVTSANSLIGSTGGDNVGNNLSIPLSNGNYVALTPSWNNGPTADVGAATFCNGTTGCSGTISPVNSLVGSNTGDQIGNVGLALAGGNYVVLSPNWKSGGVTTVGAITRGGASGISGPVTSANSLVGSTNGDSIGGAGETTALPNGDYVVRSTDWDNAGIVDAGAVTIGYQNGNTVGPITASNSVRGTIAGGGSTLNFAYDSTNAQLVVGRPAENIVSIFGQAAPGNPIPLKITSIARLTNGHIVLQGLGTPNTVCTVERSLVPGAVGFGQLAPTTANGSGVIQFEDATSAGLDRAFYRLVFP